MVVSICKNSKTLQTLNLNFSDHILISSYPYLTEIIKWCQELKEANLNTGFTGSIIHGDLEFLVQNITPNIEKLKIRGSLFMDEFLTILLGRCNKIKILSLEAHLITDRSLSNIRQHLHITLEELSLGWDRGFLSFTGFHELNSMPRLKILNLYKRKEDSKEIKRLREYLPHLKIYGVLN